MGDTADTVCHGGGDCRDLESTGGALADQCNVFLRCAHQFPETGHDMDPVLACGQRDVPGAAARRVASLVASRPWRCGSTTRVSQDGTRRRSATYRGRGSDADSTSGMVRGNGKSGPARLAVVGIELPLLCRRRVLRKNACRGGSSAETVRDCGREDQVGRGEPGILRRIGPVRGRAGDGAPDSLVGNIGVRAGGRAGSNRRGTAIIDVTHQAVGVDRGGTFGYVRCAVGFGGKVGMSRKILLTSVCRPLGPKYGDAASVGYELLNCQVTRAQGLFSPRTVNRSEERRVR